MYGRKIARIYAKEYKRILAKVQAKGKTRKVTRSEEKNCKKHSNDTQR